MDVCWLDGSRWWWRWWHILINFWVNSFFMTSHETRKLQGAVSNTDSGLSHFQPMVSFLCGHGKYQNQYLDENKRWITDPDPKATCTKDKLEILEYCRKVSSVFLILPYQCHYFVHIFLLLQLYRVSSLGSSVSGMMMYIIACLHLQESTRARDFHAVAALHVKLIGLQFLLWSSFLAWLLEIYIRRIVREEVCASTHADSSFLQNRVGCSLSDSWE